ncbi:MAG: hypothetical protein K6E97_03615 [Treponema sp.]|nr:hypothetical protein [Treponema sp.]
MDKLLIRKDIYDGLLEKGYGKKDVSKLQKVQITDKNGHTRNVYKKTGIKQKEGRQPKAQEELTPEKKAKYEEMLKKVKSGPEKNALFYHGEMMNKKEAIAHLEGKLGKKTVNSAAQEPEIPIQGTNWISLPSGTRVTNESAREKMAKNNERIETLKKLMEGNSKADNFRLKSELRSLQNENEYIASRLPANKEEKKLSQDDMKENYLDARNEGGRDIADENRVDDHSKKAINLSDSEVKKMQKLFDYIPENTKGVQIMNTIYDEDKGLYKKLSDMDVEYKKLHPEAEGKTFGFDLATKYLEDSFNEYKKDHEVGKDKFAKMSVEDIRKEQQNLLDDYNQYYNAYKNGKNDGSKLREYFKKFDVYKTALDKKSKE